MAGKGPAPKAQRYRRNTPARGEWQPSPDGGWQHDLPAPPAGLLPGTVTVWESWFKAWWAGPWTLDDLPQLRFIIRLFDRVSRGDVQRLAELRQWFDTFGISPKGQQDRRWTRPEPPKPAQPWSSGGRLRRLRVTDDDPYTHLRATDGPVPPPGRHRLLAIHDDEPDVRATDAAIERPAASQRSEAIAAEEEARRTRSVLAVLDGERVEREG